MKKKLTGKQIKGLLIVWLFISLVNNFSDLVKGFQTGWNSVNYTVASK